MTTELKLEMLQAGAHREPLPSKTIILGFRIPADIDTPSEVLARMKWLLIQALARDGEAYTDERRLVTALLTES